MNKSHSWLWGVGVVCLIGLTFFFITYDFQGEPKCENVTDSYYTYDLREIKLNFNKTLRLDIGDLVTLLDVTQRGLGPHSYCIRYENITVLELVELVDCSTYDSDLGITYFSVCERNVSIEHLKIIESSFANLGDNCPIHFSYKLLNEGLSGKTIVVKLSWTKVHMYFDAEAHMKPGFKEVCT